MLKHWVARTLFAGLVGCGSTSLTTVGPPQPSRDKNCEFDLYTAMPGGAFTEIGTVDSFGPVSTDLARFKSSIRDKVCKAGGDAAIAFANGNGVWVKATVLKKKDTPATPASAAAAPSTDCAGGCQYDKQCKGERVCREGKCVDP